MNLCVECHCLFASSSSRYFAVSWTLLSFWIGENVCPARDVKPVLELYDVVYHLLVHIILLLTECSPGLWYSSRAANLSHSSLPARLQRRHCENCVIRTGLVRFVLVDDDAFPDGRGELWVTSWTILACCRHCPSHFHADVSGAQLQWLHGCFPTQV